MDITSRSPSRLMDDPDPLVRARAANAWCAWEDAVLSLEPSARPRPYSDRPPAAMLALVRICAHHAAHGAWLEEGVPLRHAGRLADLPGVLIHGPSTSAARWTPQGNSPVPGQTLNSSSTTTQSTRAVTSSASGWRARWTCSPGSEQAAGFRDLARRQPAQAGGRMAGRRMAGRRMAGRRMAGRREPRVNRKACCIRRACPSLWVAGRPREDERAACGAHADGRSGIARGRPAFSSRIRRTSPDSAS